MSHHADTLTGPRTQPDQQTGVSGGGSELR